MTMTDYTGQTLADKYQLTTMLGQGGMGTVYRGEHIVIGKRVAVKFLHAEFASNPDVVKRFYREAQAAAAIGHDSIIDVMDVGVSAHNEPYLVMEYLEGESLGDMLARTGPLELGAALGIVEPVLRALHAAHIKGIVHRDLKPDNIFIVRQASGPPKIKIIDFGISKFAEGGGSEKLTQTGSVMGTPAYMSPEQARGAASLDHRADLYSLGVILFEMLTGKLPFSGANFTDLIVNILTAEPLSPSAVYAAFPKECEGLILKSLAKDPANRFTDAISMLDAFAALTAFGVRHEKLTHIAAAAPKTTFAAGNLGGKLSAGSGPDVAKNVLSEVIRARTPIGWTGPAAKKKGSPKALLVVIGIAAVLSVGGAIAAFVLSGKDAQPVVVPAPVPAAAPVAPARSTVTIEVLGAPSDALIHFDGVLVTVNPFRVKAREVPVELQVRANGYEPFVTSVTPSADRQIPVSLVPAKK